MYFLFQSFRVLCVWLEKFYPRYLLVVLQVNKTKIVNTILVFNIEMYFDVEFFRSCNN